MPSRLSNASISISSSFPNMERKPPTWVRLSMPSKVVRTSLLKTPKYPSILVMFSNPMKSNSPLFEIRKSPEIVAINGRLGKCSNEELLTNVTSPPILDKELKEENICKKSLPLTTNSPLIVVRFSNVLILCKASLSSIIKFPWIKLKLLKEDKTVTVSYTHLTLPTTPYV